LVTLNKKKCRNEKIKNKIYNMEKKKHLTWWDNNLSNRNQEFSNWLETSDVESRNVLFKFIDDNNLNNILECGPGTYIDYNLYFKSSDKKYSAIDITDKVVNNGLENGIDVSLSSIEYIKKTDDEYDLVYCRHVLEHQDFYQRSIDEMIRVSKKYVIVIFWLLSEKENDLIKYDEREFLYHNSYSKKNIEKYLESKGVKFVWEFAKNDKILIIEK
jgi:ubiquinone/menaquinone biosynthesis C-methylase UbiE